MIDKTFSSPVQPAKPAHPLPLDAIRQAVENVRFGSVQLIIQDGRIIQIDVTDKKRLI